MNADDVRLLGIPRSRDKIASLDPQHDVRFAESPLLSK